uniref:Kazal-like domain-containing protein n=1 Tax=Timema monikensis TaxID=170555 RepID=A0A7R9HTR6_9NEOP|nr:unnamed protein product [Timema monikensis]
MVTVSSELLMIGNKSNGSDCFVPGWTVIGKGVCDTIVPSPPKDGCDIVCTQEYNPVCACDGTELPRTFSNQCYLKVFNCNTGRRLTVLYNGECRYY